MKLTSNNKGFTPLFLILCVLIVGALIGVGWYVYRSSTSTSSNNRDSEIQSPSISQTPPAQNTKKDNTVISLNDDQVISLFNPEDVSKLPNIVPESFKAYMKVKLRNQKPSNGCSVKYEISKVSQVNLYGGQLGTGADGRDNVSCGGGAAMFWYVNKDGSWDEIVTQNEISCDTLQKRPIYAEFVETCLLENAAVQNPNPNGSIKDR